MSGSDDDSLGTRRPHSPWYRSHGSIVEWHDVMDFEVGQAVSAHERCGSITTFAATVCDLQHPCFHRRVSHVRCRNRRHPGWLKAAEWTRSKRLLPQCRHVPGQPCRIGCCNKRFKKFDATRMQPRDHLFLDGGANVFRGQIAHDPRHFQVIQRRRPSGWITSCRGSRSETGSPSLVFPDVIRRGKRADPMRTPRNYLSLFLYGTRFYKVQGMQPPACRLSIRLIGATFTRAMTQNL